jgi:hypothetical protein
MQNALPKRQIVTAIVWAAVLYGCIFVVNWLSPKACSTDFGRHRSIAVGTSSRLGGPPRWLHPGGHFFPQPKSPNLLPRFGGGGRHAGILG